MNLFITRNSFGSNGAKDVRNWHHANSGFALSWSPEPLDTGQ